MPDLDLLIIGTGSGNSILTREFEDWRVGIVERDVFGGTCLTRGCIPSKMLVVPANRVVESAEAGPLGVDLELRGVDWPAIRDRIFGRIDPITASGLAYREGQPHVEVLHGDARFTGLRTVQVRNGPDTTEVNAERIVLAAGARPYLPPVRGLADTPFHTSDSIMRIERLPEHLIILGGGYIAAELGHVFAALGSRVSVVHRGDRLVRHEDVEVSNRFTEEFGRSVFLHLNSEASNVSHRDGEFTVEFDCEHPGRGSTSEVLTGDALLVTTGRIPNGAQLDVAATGVRLDAGGYVVTDDTLWTGVDGVYALGDIRNHIQLKHLANQDARVVSHNLLHPEDPITIHQDVVPHAIFSHPEIGSVGEREVDLDARRHPYRVGRCDYAGIAYGWALEDTTGFAKLLVCAETGLLLGGHVIGYQAATLVQQVAQAMQFGITAERLAREQIWCHPALPELLENALLDALG
jgi:mycothione reductase